VAARLQGIDDPRLVLGRNTAAHVELVGPGGQFLVAELFDFRTGQHQPARSQQADVPGDGLGGVLVIAGHHDALEAGAASHLQRFDHLGPRRVYHAEQPDKHEILLDAFRGYARRDFRQRAKCHCQHPQRVARHVVVLPEYRLALLSRQADGPAGLQPLAAEIEDDIGRALDEGDNRRRAGPETAVSNPAWACAPSTL